MIESVTPLEEVLEEISRIGGETLSLCYQCGVCTATCPWGMVRKYSLRRMLRLAQLGLGGLEGDELWLCTTCKACVKRCPRGVEVIDVIKAMRKIVVEGGLIPSSLRTVLSGVLSQGNPWGGEKEKRGDWADGLDVKLFSKGMEVLYFVGCTSSYDPRNRKVAQSMTNIFKRAGVDFGILGSEENCCGDSIRKIGDEILFQRLVKENVESFKRHGVRKVVTTSPHCFNVLKKEYPHLDGLEVLHYTQYLAQLVKEGRLKFSKGMNHKVTYHDPCYLGRHNEVYEAPREILKAIPGIQVHEMGRSMENSLCCGGGGGRIWMETEVRERFSDLRVKEAVDSGAEVLATSCPFCILNFEASVKTIGAADLIRVKDVAELVQEAL